MHPGLKLRHIRLFLAVADLGSLTAAGQHLGLTQPAVSRALAEMEALLGARLLHRQGRRVTPTPAGEAFRRLAREAMARLEAAAAAVHPGADPGRLAVGLLPTVSTRFFPLVAVRSLAEQPGVTLAIETGSHPDLLRRLRDRQFDLMIGRMPHAAEMAGLDFEFLYEEPIIAVARAGHPLAGQALEAVLPRVPLMLPTRESIIRRTIDDFLAARGMAGLRPAIETSTLALGRGLVLASDAVWFISEGVVAAELEAGLMRRLPLGATYLSGAVGMTVVQSLTRDPRLEVLMRLAREQAAAA